MDCFMNKPKFFTISVDREGLNEKYDKSRVRVDKPLMINGESYEAIALLAYKPEDEENAEAAHFWNYMKRDGQWYRVKVNSMLDEYSAAVKLVDYGDYSMMQLENMQPLWLIQHTACQT